MSLTPLTWSLTISSDLRLLAVARSFMESICRAGRLSDSTTDAIILALHEAVSNVIRHAHRDLPGASLQIACALDDERIEINLRDEGEPFDLAAVPTLNPAEIRLGGRGVFLMRSLMDELHCEALPERGNHLRMVKYRTRIPRHREHV
ncbi:MAG TPA: ATP-binding protein [Gemmataceae bacterium]|jgi:serine/threonine-protein kinase RsbW|nr:ATP-binding protein [Gemmataceae bacterium]